MFQEIKYRLFEIYLTQKKKLVLFACLIFVGLFVVSQTTHAFALDLANVQLDALDFIDNTVLKWLVFIALLAIESVTLLNISARLLDWSCRLPVALNDNPLVDAGWHFTSGLANITFILIFVAIALAYVFKLETFGMKKALPRLIIIALLINFSLLFVKMLSDIGWIFQNSFSSVFFEGGGGFATAAASALTASTNSLLSVIIGIPVAYLAIAWIPYVNVVALTAIGALVLATGGGALLGTISQVIMVIVFNFTVGFIFLVFAALFLVRIAAIWLLAIFAPLAFMAFILPNTKKYFDQWMKALVQWVLLGVVVYFLVGLGLMLFGLVAPGSGQEIQFSGELGKWKFFDTFYKYIFLVIYMIVVFMASKKLVPIGTQMIWGLAEKAVKKGAGLATIKTVKAGIFAGGKAAPGLEKYGENMRAWGEKPTKGLSRVGRFAARHWGTAVADIGRAAKAQREEQVKQDISIQSEEMKKDLLPHQILGRFKTALGPQAKAASLWALSQKDPKKYDEYKAAKRFTEDDEAAVGKLLWDRGQKEFASLHPSTKMAKAIFPAEMKAAADMIKQGKEASETPWPSSYSAQMRIGAKIAEGLKGEELEKEQIQKLISGIKPSQVPQMSSSSFQDPLFLKTTLDIFGGGHMSEIARNFGREAVNEIQKGIDEIKTQDEFKGFAKKNPGLALWLNGGQANNLGFRLPIEFFNQDQKMIKEIVKDARVALEQDRSNQKNLIKRDYAGDREPLMFKDYYRPDIGGERKSLIKEIVSEMERKLPTKEEVNRSIGKLETNYQESSKKFADSLKNLQEAQEKYQKAIAQGIADPQLREIEKVVNGLKQAHQTTKQKTEASMNEIEKLEAEKLKTLWKK